MLSQKLFDYLLNKNYTFDETMNFGNRSKNSERKEFLQIRAKTFSRREPALSHNVTLMVECGIVLLVITIVGLVFYCSHRSFKKRTNIHRRRWLESDVNIGSYNENQIYDVDTSPEENPSMHLDQDDCPPPYDLVVQQSIISSKMGRDSRANNVQKYEKTHNPMDRNLRRRKSSSEEFESYMHSSKAEPLLQTIIPSMNTESSTLIDRGTLVASSSHSTNADGNDDQVISEEHLKVQIIADVHNQLKNSHSQRTERNGVTHEKSNYKIMQRENTFGLIDTSGLPSYDTALKIQECGNI